MPLPESLRDALGRDESYPLRRMDLESALQGAGVDGASMIYFLRWGIELWHKNGSSKLRLVTATFVASTRAFEERIELRIHAVPRAVGQEMRTALRPELPAVALWVRRAQTAENVWKSHDHELLVWWDGARLVSDTS